MKNPQKYVFRIASLTLALHALFPSEGHAESFNAGIAVNITFPWGKFTRPGVGIEAFTNYSVCTDFTAMSLGPSLQWSTGFGQGQRFTIAGRLDTSLLLAEPGLEFGTSKGKNGWSLHRGLKVGSLFSNIFVRGDANGYYMGLGPQANYNLDYGEVVPVNGLDCYIVDGRPLRNQEGTQCTGTHHWKKDTCDTPIESETASILAQKWSSAAQHELDSVPAFLQLAWELIANYAPDELITAALDAAEDEIKHAQQCIRMAHTYRREQLHLTPPSSASRPLLTGKAGLMRLAAESWLDGCLGEGFAAQRAQVGATHAQKIQAQQTQTIIAKDEHKHAELGWKILSWVLSQDTDGEIRQYLAQMRTMVPQMSTETQNIEILQHGCIPNQHQEAIWKKVQQPSIARLERLLHNPI